MKVCLLSTSDGKGGAAKAAFRLNGALRAAGVDSDFTTPNPVGDGDGVVSFPQGGGPVRHFRRTVRRFRAKVLDRRLRLSRPAGSEIFSADRSPFAVDFERWRPECDLINLHWVSRFVDVATFFDRCRGFPMVWTLHDMNPFTGGCHYDLGCGRFVDGCGRCPELGSTRQADLSAAVLRRKKAALAALPKGRFHVVAPSRWLAEEARRSRLFSPFPVSVIPNGIDTDLFRPGDRDAQRQALGIRHDTRVVLFVAHSTKTRRKGFAQFVEALKHLPAETAGNFMLLTVGEDEPALGAAINHRHLGFVGEEPTMASVYGASDLLALPSSQDNLPNTMIEALACGTPTVAFGVGGIPDFVRPDETGFLVPPGDTQAFAIALADALSDVDRLERMSEACRRLAVEKCALPVQARQYRELFENLIASRQAFSERS